MSEKLLNTKLFVPPLRPLLIPRPHLAEKLNGGLAGKLTLISAPAGYGKTTLAAQWLRGLERQVAWLTLDETDNDPAQFMAYCVAAIKTIAADFGESTTQLLQSPRPPPPPILLTTFINELTTIAAPFILVLDEYQAIQDLPIHQQIAFILEHQPPQMHLVIVTREDPLLPAARLRARGQLCEIRQQELRFDEAETAVFLNDRMGLQLLPEDVRILAQRTEGWIAGLQMAALSMRGQRNVKQFARTFTGSHQYILEFLLEEVFGQQPVEIQEFLLKTAVLNKLSASLCDAITGHQDSDKILPLLEQANLFITSLDQSQTWFRYHRLFAELLRHRLSNSAHLSESRLHQKAALWYEENGFLTDAINHALAARAWEVADRVITQASTRAISRGQFMTLAGWLEKMPETIVRQSLYLATFKAWSLFVTGKVEEVTGWVDVASSLLPTDPKPFNSGALTALRASLALAQFDIAQTVKLSQETLEIIVDDDPYFLRGMALNNLGQAQMYQGNIAAAAEAYRQLIHLGRQVGHHLSTFGSIGSLAWLLNLQGQRREAMLVCRHALEECVDRLGRPLPLAGTLHAMLGLAHLDGNELDEAGEHIQKAVAYGEQLGPAAGGLTALVLLARWQQAVGDPEATLATIQDVHKMGAQLNSPFAQVQIAGTEANIQMNLGNVVAVERWAGAAGISPTDTPNHPLESDYFTLARLLLAQNRLDQAQTLLASCQHFAQDNGRHRSLMIVYILQSQMAQSQSHQAEAMVKLEQALRLAAPEGYRRLFLDEGKPLWPLLPKLRQAAPDFVDYLLDYIPAEPEGSPAQEQMLLDPLSERELEVLQMLAAGSANRAIAEELFISLGTVKSHVHHILQKLNVQNRTQAVARARDLKLLSE